MTLIIYRYYRKISIISYIMFSFSDASWKYISQWNSSWYVIYHHFISALNFGQLNKGLYFMKASRTMAWEKTYYYRKAFNVRIFSCQSLTHSLLFCQVCGAKPAGHLPKSWLVSDSHHSHFQNCLLSKFKNQCIIMQWSLHRQLSP